MKQKRSAKVRSVNPITKVIDAINQDFGDGTLQRISGEGISVPLRGVYSTGLETIDQAWGRGGAPQGRIAILHGKEGGGKTTIALTTAAKAQQAGALVVYVDAEYKLDSGWATTCGLDLDQVVLCQPNHLEQAIAIIESTMQKAALEGWPTFAVLDSMNACPAKKEYEGEIDEEHYYGPKAKVYSNVLPRIAKIVQTTNSVLMLVSQTRSGPRGNHIACGNAPKFYSSSILSFRIPQGHQVKRADQVIAVELEVELVKNQVAPPYRKARFRITPNGPDFEWSLIEAGIKLGLISKGAAGWAEWKHGEGAPFKFQGSNGFRKHTTPELTDKLRRAVRHAYNEKGSADNG